MKSEIVYHFFEKLQPDNLSFLYQGAFNDEITDHIIDLSEYNLNNKGEAVYLSNRVSFLMAECFQNIVRHGDKPTKKADKKAGLFVTRNIGRAFFITSGNLIDNAEIPELKRKLEQINKLGKDELKMLYLSVLGSERQDSKTGAGLGLIEMARRSGQSLDYTFIKINDTHSFFYLQIKLISASQKIQPKQHKLPLSLAGNLHALMSKHDILIVQKGDFAKETVLPVLKMIEDTITEQVRMQKMRKKTFHLLVEILQNVGKHSLKVDNNRSGIFLMYQQKGNFKISTGNYIASKGVPALQMHLSKLNSLSRDELVELYKQTLKEGKVTHKGGAGLGLIDIARESSTKLEFDFIEIDKNKHFFILQAQF